MGRVLLMMVVVSLVLATLIRGTFGSDWTYSGVDSWPLLDNQCGGQRQSPIDITTVEPFSDHQPFTFLNYEMTDVLLTNNGHSLAILLPNLPLEERPRVSGGGLGATYVLDSFHFHWGSTSHQGSEHLLHGCAFDGEMHLVHVKEGYETVSEALNHEDGLAVLGVWLTEDHSHVFKGKNPHHHKPKVDRHSMKKRLKHRPSKSSHAHHHNWLYDLTPTQPNHSHINLRQLLPEDVHTFYRYNGSLTTPPCTENVLWTVMSTPMIAPRVFLEGLRALVNPDSTSYHVDNNDLEEPEETMATSLSDNFRPTQPLGTRNVYYSGDLSEWPTTCDQ